MEEAGGCEEVARRVAGRGGGFEEVGTGRRADGDGVEDSAGYKEDEVAAGAGLVVERDCIGGCGYVEVGEAAGFCVDIAIILFHSS